MGGEVPCFTFLSRIRLAAMARRAIADAFLLNRAAALLHVLVPIGPPDRTWGLMWPRLRRIRGGCYCDESTGMSMSSGIGMGMGTTRARAPARGGCHGSAVGSGGC